jgi:hypothetical protein
MATSALTGALPEPSSDVEARGGLAACAGTGAARTGVRRGGAAALGIDFATGFGAEDRWTTGALVALFVVIALGAGIFFTAVCRFLPAEAGGVLDTGFAATLRSGLRAMNALADFFAAGFPEADFFAGDFFTADFFTPDFLLAAFALPRNAAVVGRLATAFLATSRAGFFTAFFTTAFFTAFFAVPLADFLVAFPAAVFFVPVFFIAIPRRPMIRRRLFPPALMS